MFGNDRFFDLESMIVVSKMILLKVLEEVLEVLGVSGKVGFGSPMTT